MIEHVHRWIDIVTRTAYTAGVITVILIRTLIFYLSLQRGLMLREAGLSITSPSVLMFYTVALLLGFGIIKITVETIYPWYDYIHGTQPLENF